MNTTTTTTTTITYAVGDLVNGNYTTTAGLEEALAIYNDDAAAGAQSAFDNRADDEERAEWSFEDFLKESKEFHYVEKITTIITTDEDGDEETEEISEIIEGGTMELNA